MPASVTLPNPGPVKSLIATALAAQPGAPRQEQLAGAIQEVTLETQIAGAGMLIVTMIDPDLELQQSGFVNPDVEGIIPAVQLNFPAGSDMWWRLVMVEGGVDNSQPNLTLTFQDLVVAELRDHWGAMIVARGTTTRAQFVKQLVDQVGRGSWARTELPISFIAPSLNLLQSVQTTLAEDLGQVQLSTAVQQQIAHTAHNKQPGLSVDSPITVRGLPPTTEQIANITRAMSLANLHGASKPATLGLLCAGIGESGWRSIPNTQGSPYWGVLQGSKDTFALTDVTGQVTAFLLGGKGFQGGGAIALAKQNPPPDPGLIATTVEASGQPAAFYSKWLTEAQAIYARGGAESGTADAAGSVASDVAQLTRGTAQNPSEDSWDCITRLAQQVGWFAFTYGMRLFYMNGDDLIRQVPKGYIDFKRDRGRILPSSNWTFDNTAYYYRSTHHVKGRIQRRSKISKPQTPSQVMLDLVCGVDDFRAGDVIVLQNFGIPDGRWIVGDATRNVLADTFTQLTLSPGIAPYPEPQATASGIANTTSTSNGSATSPGAAAGQVSSSGSTSSSTYGDPGLAAMAALAQKQLYQYTESLVPGKAGLPTRMNGGSLFGSAPRTMDCSAFAILCYKASLGYPDPSGNDFNGTGNTTSILSSCVQVVNPVSGDICLYGPGPEPVHATVYVGNGNVVSMGRPGDPSLGPAAQMGPAAILGYFRPKSLVTQTVPTSVFSPAASSLG